MKLIDILVRELPKRGGWPEGMKTVAQSRIDGELYFYEGEYNPRGAALKSGYCLPMSEEVDLNIDLTKISRDQYESALAASQKPAWNGEGLPPVGCECEWRDKNVGCIPVTIKYISEQIVVMASPTNLCGVQELTEIAKYIICDKPQFRPLRTEADKKRDEAVQEILKILEGPGSPYSDVKSRKIYDAIAAGKIPGVKLED